MDGDQVTNQARQFGSRRVLAAGFARSAVFRQLAVVAVIAPGLLFAQGPSETSSLADAHISPTLYFPSAPAESESRQSLHASIAPMVKEIASSPDASLARNLEAANQTLMRLQRHEAYLRVLSLRNSLDQEVKTIKGVVETDEEVLTAAIAMRLRRVPPKQISALGRYAFLAEQAQRDAAHALNPETERYRGMVTNPIEESISDSYDSFIRAVGSFKDVSSTDLATRRAAITRREEAYDQAAPVVAALLASLVEVENRDAVAQGYANAADRQYQSLVLSASAVDQTLAAVQAEAPVYRQYQRLLAEHASGKLGVSPVLASEQELASTPATPVSLTQARHLVLDALQPLGKDYTQRFAQLLDPANGRLDLAGGIHRANKGTSISAYDAPTALYYSGYDGSLKNVSTIAHEGGHAIHRELMNASGIPVYEREGPHYLFEGFAIFNELLLLEHATTIAKTPTEREYALERLLWKISVELFVSAEEATFERNLYLQGSGQAMFDRSEIDTIYRASVTPYEYWPIAEVGTSRHWMQKSLLFQDPLYLINYLYASVVAVALYDKSQSDPDFAAKYERLLRHGFDAEPQLLLKSLDIRLDDPALIKAASARLESKTAELKQLYDSEAAIIR